MYNIKECHQSLGIPPSPRPPNYPLEEQWWHSKAQRDWNNKTEYVSDFDADKSEKPEYNVFIYIRHSFLYYWSFIDILSLRNFMVILLVVRLLQVIDPLARDSETRDKSQDTSMISSL